MDVLQRLQPLDILFAILWAGGQYVWALPTATESVAGSIAAGAITGLAWYVLMRLLLAQTPRLAH